MRHCSCKIIIFFKHLRFVRQTIWINKVHKFGASFKAVTNQHNRDF